MSAHLRLAAALALLLSACDESRTPSAVAGRTLERELIGPVPGAARQESPRNPYAEHADARMEGRRLFVAFNCAGCHGDHGGGGMGPSLRDEIWVYGGSDADIYDSIAEGRAFGMPAWGTLLPPDTIWKMAAYISSMRSSDEPMAPQP